MIVQFAKYQGTGNDFIMVDGRSQETIMFERSAIRHLCHRRFGIGADGLILLEDSASLDFRMRYYNADGREGTMCGNGGRCITAYARELGLIRLEASFEGMDGAHTASILPNGEIRLALKDVEGITWLEDGYLVDTGSPHLVQFVSGLKEMNVEEKGWVLRNQERFGRNGVNVNFVEEVAETGMISMRTYERGVEAETLSCGTGAAAAAICAYYHYKTDNLTYHVTTPGGKLVVSFRPQHHNEFTNVYLTGPVEKVFSGSVEL